MAQLATAVAATCLKDGWGKPGPTSDPRIFRPSPRGLRARIGTAIRIDLGIGGRPVSGDYYVHRLQVSMPLATAEAIANAAIAAGHEAGLLPLTVAVLDAGGNIVILKREDGSGILRADIALGKAWGALGMGISSRTIRDRLKDRPAFQSALAAASDGRFVPVPGGVLALNDKKEVIGAVGISGDASDKDEYAAVTAVRNVGLTPHPEQPADNWRDAGLWHA
jgi:uncharacterized protein GlcG (DUF336 family)